MGKMKTLDYFYKRNADDKETNHENEESKRQKTSTSEPQPQETENQQENEPQPQEKDKQQENEPQPQEKGNPNEVDLKNLERDPAKRKQMWDYPVNLREQMRRAYLNLGAFQIHLKEYQAKCSTKHPRSDNWKKVNDGKNCAFLKHIGCSQHRNVVAFVENLMNQAAHIENIIMKQNEAQILKNRLCLKVSIDTVLWLTFQACALRGHDETLDSKNRGNFLQLLKLLASYNDEVANVILEKAPYNSKYTSADIQKEILSIIANKVQKHIRSEVGDLYFCVMVDESRDESKKEQMAIVLRFVDVEGIIRERFLDLVHVRDTLSLTLKTNMWRQLLHYQFDVSKIRGQGYDGASNMRGEWNGLQALVLEDCLCASSKRHDELQKEKATEIEQLLELGEIESGKGLNQVGTLRRAGDTHWGSHFRSVCSLLNMFACTRVVLQGIIDDVSATYSQRGDADAAYCYLKSFEFVFILHLIKEVIGKTEILSQALQKKSQDILNVMELVSATKEDMNAPYTSIRYRPRKIDNHVTFEHFYRVDLFTATLDKQLHELNSRFNDRAMELLRLSSTLVSKVINVDQICLLVEKYYPEIFTEQERIQLRYQLEIFNIDITKNLRLSGVSTIADLCKRLVETQKRETYFYRNNREGIFSMSDDFLANNLVIYIEREIVENIDSKSVIDEFKDIKGRRAEL
ncbi:uncharacterized protein LOC111901193 [Lactuca sativa]|uniref:uncharacterized protein LOC111901193 n=1 Tax=Lactuca sativa TaxID=4236 RepID=UPI001C6903D1|nr:uncharacterized protein LOC111901193 [Lactuca sativa]